MDNDTFAADSLVFGEAISREECRALIAVSEAARYTPAPIAGRLDGACGFRVSAGRNNCRAAVDDKEFAAILWSRLQRFAPPRLAHYQVVGTGTPGDGVCPAGAREISRWCSHRNSSPTTSRPEGALENYLILRASGAREI